MKFFTRQRTAVLVTLCAVIAVLFSIIISTELLEQAAELAAAPVHNTMRDARVGLTKGIVWENNFGGSDDEHPTSALTANGKLYVFGITESDDLDFEGGGGAFIARISSFGSTEAFAVIPNVTDIKVALVQSGFAIVCGGATATVKYIDYEGNITKSVELSHSAENCTYSIADVGFNQNRLYIFRQSSNYDGPSHIICDVIEEETIIASHTLRQTLGLEYLGFFPTSVPVVALRELGSDVGCVTFASISASGSVTYNRVLSAHTYMPLSVAPSPHGWLVLSSDSGETFVNVVSYDYDLIRKVYIPFPAARSGKLYQSVNASKWFIEVRQEGEIGNLYSLDFDITVVNVTAAPSFSSLKFYGTSQFDVIAFSCATGTEIYISEKDLLLQEISVPSASFPIIARFGSNWYIIFSAGNDSGITGNNFGGDDIVVAKINL